MILKVSATDLAGVQKVTQVLSEIVVDPHLKLESLQPANSFIIRVATTIHSASYATCRGKLISNLIGVRVLALQADAERAGEDTFDEFLTEVSKGAVFQETSNKMKEKYPSWKKTVERLEETIGMIARERENKAKEKKLYYLVIQRTGERKIEVIKEVRAITRFGLKEAKDIVETVPQLVKVFDDLDSANQAAESLRRPGAIVKVLRSKSGVRKLVGNQKQVTPELERAIR